MTHALPPLALPPLQLGRWAHQFEVPENSLTALRLEAALGLASELRVASEILDFEYSPHLVHRSSAFHSSWLGRVPKKESR